MTSFLRYFNHKPIKEREKASKQFNRISQKRMKEENGLAENTPRTSGGAGGIRLIFEITSQAAASHTARISWIINSNGFVKKQRDNSKQICKKDTPFDLSKTNEECGVEGSGCCLSFWN